MPLPSRVVIADTSCFILLDKIGELILLRHLFIQVVTTTVIASEFGSVLPDWISIEEVTNTKYQRLLELEVDKGEASAIALGSEKENSLLILDDLQTRNLAQRLGLSFTGTLGLIAKAKQEGIIPSVKPIVQKIRETNFRFSEEVFTNMLKAAGEL
ncbi:DUF3368 domain-containing protein [Rufibacter glacialis]|uniref:DUF3368 domain-containing protein n=1 Tax=Rufibacter glacialis TaxID=1259555 RepID=A0A5M8QHN6_9BACT|nr:DUF3368 domain-containing protein [Rufibacter glacialis]KAA6434661.1 DUF3368 domain-containing protein [Rufibacter glacialis]GGK71422.1 DUF3368 domain-containing protein [Rufibacter glacialis]